jgi:addiction module RelE/StbE family toxin
MKIVYSKDFIKSVKRAPKQIQNRLADLIKILQQNPFHPKLHSKPLVGKLKGFYSFRITCNWCVIFSFFDSETIFLIDIAHRKDIYKK